MSNYILNSARDVSESEVRAFAEKIRKRELILVVSGRTGPPGTFAYWKSAYQGEVNSKIEKISLGDYAPNRWHDVQANKTGSLEKFESQCDGANEDEVARKREALEANLKEQERKILLGETLARTVTPDSEFALALDKLSKAMALHDGASSALVEVQQDFPSEMATFLLADSRDNKGQFYENLLAATVDWEELIVSSGMYNPFRHITIDGRSDATPAYAVTISNPEDLTHEATTDKEYTKRKGHRVKVLRRVARNLSVSASSNGSRSLFSRARNELRPRQIHFQPTGEASSQSGPADEQELDPFGDDAVDSTSIADPFGDHARGSTSVIGDRLSSDAQSYQDAHDIDELF